ncbi:TetR/AcrR family transcriptional regulator [Novacetimonas pomaceti]|uniref:TetR/AcrR family transcriptional regulator n=1 Tax=Novacetimonas pomaceti TaxID=2021998 RepID=A0ABX5P999_9PROT|nr:TetR/AcrR family transcriptional regulator [Novacetimonas pomaceti]PYD48611.1 TetR/AcrR family transcriptional regulator [Novacetimonas pomaceti]
MRLTRKETQEQTRHRLITAANVAIATEGVAAASIRRICDMAGHSQGAFYSNFKTKDDLLLEIMRAHIEEEAMVLRTLVSGARGADLNLTLAQLSVRLAELAGQPQWSLLSIELQLHAQRDSQFAARYNDCKSACHAVFSALLEELTHLYGLHLILPVRQVAIGLYALWSGLIVQGSVAGAFPRDQIFLAFFRSVTGCPAETTQTMDTLS